MVNILKRRFRDPLAVLFQLLLLQVGLLKVNFQSCECPVLFQHISDLLS